MTEPKEEYLVDKKYGHGGARVAGPGKKIGRPEGKNRTPMTFKIPKALAERLRGEKNQTELIVKLLCEHYGVSEL